MFFRLGVIKIFANFLGKHLCWNLFIKRRFQHRCFPVKLAKFLRNSNFTEYLGWLLLTFLKSIPVPKDFWPKEFRKCIDFFSLQISSAYIEIEISPEQMKKDTLINNFSTILQIFTGKQLIYQ